MMSKGSNNERVVVAGSRSITDTFTVEQYIRSNYPSDSAPHHWNCEIVHGGARGVDSAASEFATDYGLEQTVFEPEWDEHGKSAGPMRNAKMADYGDMLVAVWDGASSGTRDMIEKALDAGMDVHVEVLNDV